MVVFLVVNDRARKQTIEGLGELTIERQAAAEVEEEGGWVDERVRGGVEGVGGTRGVNEGGWECEQAGEQQAGRKRNAQKCSFISSGVGREKCKRERAVPVEHGVEGGSKRVDIRSVERGEGAREGVSGGLKMGK